MGRRINRQLEGDQNDVLSGWMSHHIARLIEEAQSATGDARAAAEERCRAAILNLWKHRRELGDPPPLGSFDRIEETIAVLRDPHLGWYLKRQDDDAVPDHPLLAHALAVDGAAKAIIRALLSEGLAAGVRVEREWLDALGIESTSPPPELLERLSDLLQDVEIFRPAETSIAFTDRARNDIIEQLRALVDTASEIIFTLERPGSLDQGDEAPDG